MVLDLFFNLLIYPLKQVIEFSFSLFFHVFKNPGAAILGVSLAVTILCLPLYIVAEKWTDFERDIQKDLEPGVKRIKKFFKGDEAVHDSYDILPSEPLSSDYGVALKF